MLKRSVLKIYCKKQRGMATMEAMASIILYLALLSFSLGFFGVVHSGIVNSIAARTYAFDTFNNRTYLKYHRDTDDQDQLNSHKKNGFRLHTIITENNSSGGVDFIATQRSIAFVKSHRKNEGEGKHMEMVENERDGGDEIYNFNPVWVKAAYGICLNARCRP